MESGSFRGWVVLFVFSGLVLFALFLLGCSSPFPAVTVVLPDLAVYRRQEIAWDIRWWDGVDVQHRLVEPPSGDRSLRVVLPLASDGAMLPVVSGIPRVRIGAGIPLAPFGGWPQSEAEEVALVRERGELAVVLLSLAAAGLDPALVNVDRLAVVAEAGTGTPAGMRNLDTRRLEQALRNRSLRVSEVAFLAAPLRVVRTPLEAIPASGDRWFSDEPAQPVYRGESAGDYSIFSVAVMATEVRRLWREREDGGWDVLVIARNSDGNSWERRFSVPPD